jgi:signal recognition particle subunit SEC65
MNKPFAVRVPKVRRELEEAARKLGYKVTEEDRDNDLRAIIQELARKAA